MPCLAVPYEAIFKTVPYFYALSVVLTVQITVIGLEFESMLQRHW